MSKLITALESIKQFLQHHLQSEFEQPLTLSDIQHFTAALPFDLPPELLELYQWHNGQPEDQVFFDYFSFYSLQDALFEYQQLRAVSIQLEQAHGFCSWPEGRWPIFGFEGEYFCVDCKESRRPLWFVFIEDEPRYWFDSFEVFVEFLAQAFELGYYETDAEQKLKPVSHKLHELRLSQISPGADQSPLHQIL